jgi:prepilin peptidase CpaA
MEKYVLTYIDLFLFSVLITAVIYDLRFQKIPNWLTFSSFILALSYHTISYGILGIIFSVKGCMLGILLLIIPYLMGGMGAGDAKLMGAVGALLGPKGIFVAFLLTALIGGFYAFAVLAYHGDLRSTFSRYWFSIKTFILTRKLIHLPLPEQGKTPRLKYGVAIALGTMFSVLMKDTVYGILHIIY